MKYLVLSFLVLSMPAFAAEKKMKSTTKSTVKEEPKGTLDISPKSKSQEIVDETATITDKDIVKAEVTCKAHDGHVLNQNDKGYHACLQKVKSDNKNSSDPKADVEVKFEK